MSPEPHAVVIYTRGPQWRPDAALYAQERVTGHIAFIRRVLSSGAARAAGPFSQLDERVERDEVGLIVFTVPPDEARALVGEDPAVAAGLLTANVYPFYAAG